MEYDVYVNRVNAILTDNGDRCFSFRGLQVLSNGKNKIKTDL